MKKKKAKKKYKFLSYILMVLSLLLIILLGYIGVLPLPYYLVLLLFLIIINLILNLFLIHSKIKKNIKHKSVIISIILIIILTIINGYLIKTLSFFDIITSSDKQVINYSVVVKNESSYKNIEELKDKKMGYYNLNDIPVDSIKVSVDYDAYKDLNEMYGDLLSDKIESLVIEDSIKSMIEESDESLKLSTRVLFSFKVEEKEESVAKGVNTVNDSFNIYISGIDTYGDIESLSRSDVNIVVTINPKTKTILLTSIPRDYYVKLYGKEGYKDKLTHAGIYGIDTSIKTIETLLGIDINYYVKVNFTSLIDIVNILGSITVDSEYSFTSFDNYTFTKGSNKMNGEQALSFARERHAFNDGDRVRGKNQQLVITAIINKVTSPSLVTKYSELLSSISAKIKTNMTQKEMVSLVKMQIKDKASWNVISSNLEGNNGNEYTYSYKTRKLYVMVPDEESIENAKKKILEVFNEN